MREEIMNAIDSARFITLARDSMKGSIADKDPFAMTERCVKELAGTYAGVKAVKLTGRGLKASYRGYRRIKSLASVIKKLTKSGIRVTGKGLSVSGKTVKTAGQGTKGAGKAMDKAGDGIVTAAKASAAIPVADLVTVPAGLAAEGALKGAGTLMSGFGDLERMSGEGMEKAGKVLNSAGNMAVDKELDIAGKVCKAMKGSISPVTRLAGSTLGTAFKAGRYTSKAAHMSVSKMSELASKGLDRGDDGGLVR